MLGEICFLGRKEKGVWAKNIPLKINNHHPPPLPLSLLISPLPLPPRDLPHSHSQSGPVPRNDPLFPPHDGRAGLGVIGQFLGARKGWHRRHVDDSVLEQDHHAAFVEPEREQEGGEDEGGLEEGEGAEGADGGWGTGVGGRGGVEVGKEGEGEWEGIEGIARRGDGG